MLREDSVTYTSLPQDEGTTPNSSFITRSSDHNQRDCKLTLILTIGIIIGGLGLAATIPFIISGSSSNTSTGKKDSLLNTSNGEDFASGFLNSGEGNSHMLNEAHQRLTTPGGDQDVATTTPVRELLPITESEKQEEKDQPIVPHPHLVTFEGEEPPETTPTQSDILTYSDDDYSNDTTANKESLPAEFIEEEDHSKPESFDSSEDKSDDYIVTGDYNGGDTQQSVTPDKPNLVQVTDNSKPSNVEKNNDIDMNQLLNELYGEEGDPKPTSINSSSWMNSIGTPQDKVTIAALAAVVAVAIAAVIAAVVWVVYTRVASHRRRMNIQNVITDLQSRDKIVLLNSESEEE